MKFFRILFLLLCCFGYAANAQINLNDTLSVDPNVRIGKLDNGLTYYIRNNKKPEQKVELRLVVNAGSILEDVDQQGIAHLCEHMAFNGTTHFKKNDIISFLQSIGVEFGNDLNAGTSFDETTYILPIPTDKPGNIEKGFQILEDWAHNVTYDSNDIDGERPVILEERRLGKGSNDRMYRQIYPDLFAGSLYSKRLPIGIDSIIMHASYETIRKFYKDWYRPDLMAVIVVGDIDPGMSEDLVKKYFGRLKNPENERPRIHPAVPSYEKNTAKVVTDKEATNYTVIVYYSASKIEPIHTFNDYKIDIEKNLFTTLLNQRLPELTQKENPPFLYAFTDFDSYARGYESFSANIGLGNSDRTEGLKAFETELERVRKYGFTKPELDRAKSNMLKRMETMNNEKDKTESANYVSEYIQNFLTQEPIPGIDNDYKYYKELLPQITLNDINEIGNKLQQNPRQFIALLGPEQKSGKELPTATNLLSVVKSVGKMDIKPYEEKVISTTLLKVVPKPGKIIATKINTELGTKEFTLSNGITVTLKNTNFKNDEILMSGVRPGGKNNYGVRDKFNAEYATSVISSMGVGDFSPVDLQKALSGKTVKVNPVFSNISEGISGSSSVKDVETMLQLMYLYFTTPRMDSTLFKSYIQKNKAQLTFLSSNPQVVFVDILYKVVYKNNPLAPVAIPKPENFDQINLPRLMQIYKKRFGNAFGMHFTFVGSISENELKPLIEKYITSLPSSPKKFQYVDNRVRPAKGKINFTVHKGKEQKSLIVEVYSGEVPYSDALDMKADAISEILNIRIIEELREKIQGIYTGGTQSRFEKLPYPHYTFFVQLPCGPEKVDTLLYAANKEIRDLINNGPSMENMEKVKQQWLEQYKVNINENGTWLSNLQNIYFPGNDPDYFINYEKHVKALAAKDVKEAAKLLLANNFITGILDPEEK